MHNILFYYIPSGLSRIGRFANAEIRLKIIKRYLRQTLGKDIGNLILKWNMKHPNIITLNLLTNKINIHFNMLSALMMNRIARQINTTNWTEEYIYKISKLLVYTPSGAVTFVYAISHHYQVRVWTLKKKLQHEW